MPLRERPMLVGCVIAVAVLLVLGVAIALPVLYVPCPEVW